MKNLIAKVPTSSHEMGSRPRMGAAGLLLLVGCRDMDRATDPVTCNLHAELCARRVSQVTFAGTHNSMSNADAGWVFPNQKHGITRQLEDGIRGLMLDTYRWEGELWLCHGYCELGAQRLSDGLGELADFLETHPQEVIQIIFQDAIPIEDTRAALDAAGLAERLHPWALGQDPSLQELIDRQENLVVGLESGQSDTLGLHAAWALWMDTPYSFQSPADFSCTLNRGQEENSLFLVNHWLSTPLPSPKSGEAVNVAEVLEARARMCAETWGRTINFLGVDFYDRGDLLEVVDRLNGVAEPE